MGKHKAQDLIAEAVKNLDSAVNALCIDAKNIDISDLKEATKIAKEHYKDSPDLEQALDILRKKGVNI